MILGAVFGRDVMIDPIADKATRRRYNSFKFGVFFLNCGVGSVSGFQAQLGP